MDTSSGESTDVSDSEIFVYEEKSYSELKDGNHRVKNPNGTYRCPYCAGQKKQEYLYKDLLQHANGIGASSSRGGKVKANHLALVRYLAKHIPESSSSTLQPVVTDKEPIVKHNNDEQFVWPWMGIVVNVPTVKRDGKNVGESGTKLKEQLSKFNPLKVIPLWNYRGHTGKSIVEFDKGWSGFRDAMAFENYFEAQRYGKKDWIQRGHKSSSLFGWIARADDYNSEGPIGHHLRKNGDLKSINDKANEESRKNKKLVANLANQIERKNERMRELECRYNETSISLQNRMEENEKLHQKYNREMEQLQRLACDHTRRVVEENIKLMGQLDSKRLELERRKRQLDNLVAQTEVDRKKLAEEREQDLQMTRRIGLGHKKWSEEYVLVQDTPSSGIVASFVTISESSILWHHRLGCLSLHKLQQAL